MMNYTRIIARKEFKGYFNSPASYIVLVVFLLLGGWFFASPLFLNNSADLRSFFNIVPIIYLFFVPAVTMGLIAREKNAGTLELLSTFPLKDSEIVMGKFWASVQFIGVGLLFSLVHLLTIIVLGKNIDFGSIICGYAGLLLLGATYSAIGIFGSSISSNQIVSFIVSFFIIFFFFILEYSLVFIPAGLGGLFQYLSVGYHFQNLARGVIDTRDIIYFVSLIVIFLRLSTVVLEMRKWK